MAVYYFDSSAAVKKYFVEQGTGWILSLLKPSAKNIVYLAQITGIGCVKIKSYDYDIGSNL